jgi:hypothetical protein
VAPEGEQRGRGTLVAVSDSYYARAQICENGHVISAMVDRSPESRSSFCDTCGVATIAECPACHEAIRGYYFVPGVIGGDEYKPPAYCYNCGEAFPWTAARLSAARELIDDAEDLDDDERARLADTLDDLVRDTPRTQVQANRFKRLAAKAGAATADGLKSVLVDIASEAARKAVWGPGP